MSSFRTFLSYPKAELIVGLSIILWIVLQGFLIGISRRALATEVINSNLSGGFGDLVAGFVWLGAGALPISIALLALVKSSRRIVLLACIFGLATASMEATRVHLYFNQSGSIFTLVMAFGVNLVIAAILVVFSLVISKIIFLRS